MKRPEGIQYTLRGIPAEVDAELRRRAHHQKRSLNHVALEALQRGLSLSTQQVYSDLDEFVGTWVEDPEFDRIMEAQDQIDEKI